MQRVAGSSLSEIIDPHSVVELSHAIFNLLTQSDKQAVLKEKGLEQVKKFSWERCAEETISVYRQVMDEV